MDAVENFARDKGLKWVYLDSHDGLKAAISLYRKRGYVQCKRYNDNPQATIFLRKNLGRRAKNSRRICGAKQRFSNTVGCFSRSRYNS